MHIQGWNAWGIINICIFTTRTKTNKTSAKLTVVMYSNSSLENGLITRGNVEKLSCIVLDSNRVQGMKILNCCLRCTKYTWWCAASFVWQDYTRREDMQGPVVGVLADKDEMSYRMLSQTPLTNINVYVTTWFIVKTIPYARCGSGFICITCHYWLCQRLWLWLCVASWLLLWKLCVMYQGCMKITVIKIICNVSIL